VSNEIVNYDAAWAEAAQKAADQVPPQSSMFLSTRGGVLAFGEEEMPGNQACVVILDMLRENTYYAEKFDPDVAAAPVCYAFSRDRTEEMAPHPSMQANAYFHPQSETCGTCKWNEWGSADTGRGKACQNRTRLAIIPAGYYSAKKGSRDFDLELYADSAHFRKADIAYIKLPVTSGTGWWKYVSQISTQFRRPPHGVITRLFLEPHPKTQYQVHFEIVEELPNELASVIMARHEEAANMPLQGYSVPEEREAPKNGALRGLRRGR
jgi:hypothetical protein